MTGRSAKGQRYGTILIDLERGRVLDVLPGRDGEALTAWLQEHPGVEVISRDRWVAYAQAARQSAPQATQVADRWHLLKNLREAVERLLQRRSETVKECLERITPTNPPSAPSPDAPPPVVPAPAEPDPPTPRQQVRQGKRQRRVERYEHVRALHQQGKSVRGIARELAMSVRTVLRYLRESQCPDWQPGRARPTRLDGFRAYVDRRIREGCHNAAQLHRELAEQGCRAGSSSVRRFVSRRLAAAGQKRQRVNAPMPPAPKPPSAKTLSFEFLRRATERKAEEQVRVEMLRSGDAELTEALDLAATFAAMVRKEVARPLAEWLACAGQASCPEMRNFSRTDQVSFFPRMLLPVSAYSRSRSKAPGTFSRHYRPIGRGGPAGVQLVKRTVRPSTRFENQQPAPPSFSPSSGSSAAMNVLTIPAPVLRQALTELVRHADRALPLPAGVSDAEDGREVLVTADPRRAGTRAILSRSNRPPEVASLPEGCVARLTIGWERWRGAAWGQVRSGDEVEPARLLRVVGPGMHSLSLDGLSLRPEGTESTDGPAAPERWSRTVGALGLAAWNRLTGLQVGIIGASRTGSAVARLLVGLGVRRLTLIDEARLEPHHFGEMIGLAGNAGPVGRTKVHALAESLPAQTGLHPEIVPVAASITHLRALRAAQACDLLFSCLDSDAARWAVSAVHNLFLRPLIDVALGVHGRGDEREMGADVRLVLPGRCLLCLGGLRSGAEAVRALTSADAEREARARRVWHQEREGSLASLNHLAAAAAVRLLEDLVSERVQDSTWMRLTYDPLGRLDVSYPDTALAAGPTPCRVCALTGAGEEGVALVPRILRAGFDEDAS
jgi:transposase